MFESVTIIEERKRDKALSALLWSYENRYTRALGGVGLVLMGVCFMGASWAYAMAGPARCVELAPTEMELVGIQTVDRKVKDYKAHPSGEIQLDADEASLILEQLKYPVKVTGVEGEEVAARMMIRDSKQERCYDIAFTGTVDIVQGKATVIPSKLMIGGLDLSWITKGMKFYFDRSNFRDGDAGRLLEQTESLHAENGQLHIDLQDPRRLK